MLLDWPRDDHHLGLFWAALEVSDLERATWKQEIGRQHRLSHRALEKYSQEGAPKACKSHRSKFSR